MDDRDWNENDPRPDGDIGHVGDIGDIGDAGDDVAPLLHLAGRRPRLPEDEVAPLRAAAREVFRRQAERTARRRRLGWAAGAGLAAGLAAVLLLVVGPVLRRAAAPGSSQPVATLEMRIGEVALSGVAGVPSGTRTLLAGAVVTTAENGRAAVRLPAGVSVRIDGSSSVRLDSAETLTLERGALYTDSGSSTPSQGIEVATAFGSVRDVGTQFEVRLLAGRGGPSGPGAGALRVRVREGKVLVDHAGTVHQALAGSELVVQANGSFQRAAVPVFGPGWDWVQRAAPALAIEGASLADFLAWVSRETGLRWRLAGPGAGRPPEEIVLHGSIEGLTAEEALAVVLPGCGYRHRRVGGELWLEGVGRSGKRP
jgi:hypothetical protein